jgi:hypothetical protein
MKRREPNVDETRADGEPKGREAPGLDSLDEDAMSH